MLSITVRHQIGTPGSPSGRDRADRGLGASGSASDRDRPTLCDSSSPGLVGANRYASVFITARVVLSSIVKGLARS